MNVLVCVLVSMNVLCIVITFLNVKKLNHVPTLNAAFSILQKLGIQERQIRDN